MSKNVSLQSSLEDIITEENILNSFFDVFEKYKEERLEAYGFALQALGFERVHSGYKLDWVRGQGNEMHIYARQNTKADASGRTLTLSESLAGFSDGKVDPKDIDILLYSVNNEVSYESGRYIEIKPDLTVQESKSNYITPKLAGIKIVTAHGTEHIDKALPLFSSISADFENRAVVRKVTSTSFIFDKNVYSMTVQKRLKPDSSEKQYVLSCSILDEAQKNVVDTDKDNLSAIIEFSRAVDNDLIRTASPVGGDMRSFKAADVSNNIKIKKEKFQKLLRRYSLASISDMRGRARSCVLDSSKYKIANGLVCDGVKCVPMNTFLERCKNLLTKNDLSKLDRLEGFC